MNEPQVVGPSRDEQEVHGGLGGRGRRSIKLDWGSTLEWKFNELISTIHSMIDVMHSM